MNPTFATMALLYDNRVLVGVSTGEALNEVTELDAGLDHLVLHGPGHDQQRFPTRSSEDVLPALRAHAAQARPTHA
ncbi:hypothetical protein [Pseudonocardia xishanensis]|uniref:Uncharacterized protein n=1 Tax=Pseudonocardia xishanensis TaxID=630995 RepID=A0ABP8RHR9_9PSEU